MAVNEGRPQTYGTQFRAQDDDLVPFPIAEAEHVDERRRLVGLNSLAEAKAEMRWRYGKQA